MHEKQMHEDSCMVTLTYDDDHLPDHGSLSLEDMTLFLKRLRKRSRFRYFYCGEYGEERKRPHYHALLFGIDFPDKVRCGTTKSGAEAWTSPELAAIWKGGSVQVGTITFESAAYVARYCVKKVTGSQAKTEYERVDPRTGEIVSVRPEFANMSRRPGIGARWIEKFHSEVYPSDEVIVRGYAAKPPRYYDAYLKSVDADASEAVRRERSKARSYEHETADRLSVRAVCAEAKLNLYSRSAE